MRIGEVAKRSEVGIETIRYYERQGLLAKPNRSPSGYRQYDESVVGRLRFIRRAKGLGFTLAEVSELVGLWHDADTRCEQVQKRAAQKVEDIEKKVRSLQNMERSLKKLVGTCQAHDSDHECPLMEGINE